VVWSLECPNQNTETKGKTVKRSPLLAAITATAIPLATVFAENAASPTPTEQTKEEDSCCMNMTGMSQENMMKMMGMMSMMSNWKEQDAELDKLVVAMNSASSDKKIDAMAAIVAKLVEQRKGMHNAMQKMIGREMMKMGRMMMGGQENQGETEHSHH
jgi:hypothetical protein